MENELGGWVFHQKIDFSKPTPWIEIERSEPNLSQEWTEKRGK